MLITSILIFILRAVCTHTGGHYYTHDICIVFFLILFFIFTTYLISYLFIISLTLDLYFYVDHIIALIVLFIFFNCILYFMYIYGRLNCTHSYLIIYFPINSSLPLFRFSFIFRQIYRKNTSINCKFIQIESLNKQTFSHNSIRNQPKISRT